MQTKILKNNNTYHIFKHDGIADSLPVGVYDFQFGPMGMISLEKQEEYARKHYLANKEKMIEKAKKYNSSVYERNLNYIKNYLSNNPCVDCGNNNIVVLEFDHVRGEKKYNVSDM